MNNTQYIQILKVELALNTQALQDAGSDKLESLLTQRATLKDLLIAALSDALNAQAAA